MGKFLDTYPLPRPKKKEVEFLNKPIIRSEIEAAIKSTKEKKSRTRQVHNQILPGIQKGDHAVLLETIPNNSKIGNSPLLIL